MPSESDLSFLLPIEFCLGGFSLPTSLTLALARIPVSLACFIRCWKYDLSFGPKPDAETGCTSLFRAAGFVAFGVLFSSVIFSSRLLILVYRSDKSKPMTFKSEILFIGGSIILVSLRNWTFSVISVTSDRLPGEMRKGL